MTAIFQDHCPISTVKLQMFLVFTFNFSFYKCNFLHVCFIIGQARIAFGFWVITLLSTNLLVAVVVLIVLMNNEAFIYWRRWSCRDFIFPNVSWKVSLFIFFWLLRTLLSKKFLKSFFFFMWSRALKVRSLALFLVVENLSRMLLKLRYSWFTMLC